MTIVLCHVATSGFPGPFPVSLPAPFSCPPGCEASSPPSFCRSLALCMPDASRPHWKSQRETLHFHQIFLSENPNDCVFLHGLLGLFFDLGSLLLPQFLSHLRLFLHLRETLVAHLLSAQTFLRTELQCQTVWFESNLMLKTHTSVLFTIRLQVDGKFSDWGSKQEISIWF